MYSVYTDCMDTFLTPIISYEKKLKPLTYSKEHVLEKYLILHKMLIFGGRISSVL